MASNVTRDHHSLRRNLKLNDNYISNDGGDEGIRISDVGSIGINNTSPIASLDVTGLIEGSHFKNASNWSKAFSNYHSLSFDGDDDYMEATAIGSTLSQSGTISAWINTADSSVQQIVVSNTTGVEDRLILGINDGEVVSNARYDTANHTASGGTISNNTWHHIVVTSGSGTVKVYVDGALPTQGTEIAASNSSTQKLRIGLREDGADDFEGLGIDEVAIWNAALPADAIAAIYNSGKPTDLNENIGNYDEWTDNLVGYWRMEEGTGSSIADSSTNSNTGAITGATWTDNVPSYIQSPDNIYHAGNVGIGTNDPGSLLEIFSTSSQLKISYDASNYADISVDATGDLELATTGTSADIILDSANNIIFDVASFSAGIYTFKAANTDRIYFNMSAGSNGLKMKAGTQAADYSTLITASNGATTLTTVDGTGNEADLTLDIDGFIDINSFAGEDITLDSGGDITLDAAGHVKFDGCGVGFDQEEETFSGDDILASGSGTGGTHDTHIDFRIGNKIYLQMTAAMDQMNLIFPAVSGNFLLHIWYNGDWAVGDWKVWESDLTAASNADVFWPGGTQPDNTSSGKDVFSFYWDAETQVCYGVASLAFAIP
jgi:hypothetical protein